MGMYINTGNEGFRSARNGEYVDKSELIAVVNDTLNSERQFSCVSRARRFGKSMAARMLNAYYDHSCDSRELFADLKIAQHPSFEKYLNKYPVIYLDMTEFVTRYRHQDVVDNLQKDVIADLRKVYKDISIDSTDDLLTVLYAIVSDSSRKFIMIIDEWDAILREFSSNNALVDKFVDLLRRLFKSSQAMTIFAGVYITGILPIKKYNTQSALNNFEEYTMVSPGEFAPYFGFTNAEVDLLCKKYSMDINQLKIWYDGYTIGGQESIYNPISVIRALRRRYCESYWSNTGTYETVTQYIKMNFDGLKDDIINLLAGGRCMVNTLNFQNDLYVINDKNDVLTILIHLGYLSYDRESQSCSIPNKEIVIEFENAIKDTDWDIVVNALKQSDQLLKWTLAGEADKVSASIAAIHEDNTSILQYNDENSLACVLTIAYFTAKNDYLWIREMPTGQGFADFVLLPRQGKNLPVIVLELKCNQSAQTALSQIRDKHYADSLVSYSGEILLVGINYDKPSKQHSCLIERIVK